MFRRALLTCLAIGFAALGLIGLLVPILPGVLFLAVAALCFSAVSPRFQARLNRHPAWRGWQLRWRQGRGLPLLRRLKLAFWLTAEAAMKALRAPARRVRGTGGDLRRAGQGFLNRASQPLPSSNPSTRARSSASSRTYS